MICMQNYINNVEVGVIGSSYFAGCGLGFSGCGLDDCGPRAKLRARRFFNENIALLVVCHVI